MAKNVVITEMPRTGRHLQRYYKGRRQVVGCIPYRYTTKKDSPCTQELQVLVITSQKGKGMLFPKGGWEKDETMKEAALRETMEEAGVLGTVGRALGSWIYTSKSNKKEYKGFMFPLRVEEQMERWPENDVRCRSWMGVVEAKRCCQYTWMKEALDVLVRRLPLERSSNPEDH